MTTPPHRHRLDAGFIADAAAPIAAALATMADARIPVPTPDVLISYTSNGCIMRVANHRADHQEAVERAFTTAFTAAGWGVARRQAGGLGLQYPSGLTRT